MSNFTLPKLPYADDALAPVISANTISFHYGKHHKAYVDKLNELIEGTPYAALTLEEIVKKSAKDEKGKAIFNNAAQAWNHDFYWHSMAPKGGAPAGKIKKALEDSFGSVEDFNKAWDSFTVSTGLQRAEQLTERYKVQGVPVIVLNGKYTTDVGMAGGPGQLLQLINDLAASEKQRR